MIGKTISHYKILEKLGEGGMGVVYKAQDTRLERVVAIKFLPQHLTADGVEKERFVHEAKAASALSHTNVTTIYEIDEFEGQTFIVMEYCEGQTLRKIAEKETLSVKKVLDIAIQICEGLTIAHEKGIVHRDIKSDNIMLTPRGQVKIMDFGLAKLKGATRLTLSRSTLGTASYMSPEQAQREEVDHRSDIFSFGVVLYELLTGQLPFQGDHEAAVLHAIISEEPQPIARFNNKVSAKLQDVVEKALAKEKEERYQHIDDVLADLRREKKSLEYVKTTQIPPEAIPTKPKKTLLPFILPASIIFVLVLLFLILKPFQLQIVPEKKAVAEENTLAIMYFENNTGDESLDHWRKAIADLLITDLTQSKYVRVLSGDRLFNILSQLDQLEAESYSSEVLKQVAARGRVGHILVGNYAKAGENFRIDVMLQEASTGELLGSERVEGIGEESIFSMVDELTRRIKANFKLSAEEIARDIDKEVGKITTGSPEAYKYYSEGRKYHAQRDYRKSIELMEKAVAIDPDFAMAYRSLAVSYGNLGYSSENRRYAQKAFELADQVSDRERYKIQGEFYSQSGETHDKAIEAYLRLLQLYPDDVTGNNNLAVRYYNLEQWDKARERLEVCVQNKSEGTHAYTNLAYVYAAQGLYDKAREVLENYLNDISENVGLRGRVGYNYLCQGQYGLALAELDQALSIDPADFGNLFRKGDIYHCKGDLAKAEKEYQKLLEAEEKVAHLFGRGRLAVLYLSQGKFEKSKNQFKHGIELAQKLGEKTWESGFRLGLGYTYRKSGNPKMALEECNKAWNGHVEAQQLSGQRFALYSKGRTYLEMNAIDEAQRTADELKELIEKGMNRKIIRLYYHLIGMIELERGNLPKAIEYFENALSLLPFQAFWGDDTHASFIDPLALAYYEAGDLEKARQEYERITSLTTGRLSYGDIYAKSFYMLGRIYQEKGWEGKAIQHYSRFIELWKDADPGIPEVEDAKERLANLKATS